MIGSWRHNERSGAEQVRNTLGIVATSPLAAPNSALPLSLALVRPACTISHRSVCAAIESDRIGLNEIGAYPQQSALVSSMTSMNVACMRGCATNVRDSTQQHVSGPVIVQIDSNAVPFRRATTHHIELRDTHTTRTTTRHPQTYEPRDTIYCRFHRLVVLIATVKFLPT